MFQFMLFHIFFHSSAFCILPTMKYFQDIPSFCNFLSHLPYLLKGGNYFFFHIIYERHSSYLIKKVFT